MKIEYKDWQWKNVGELDLPAELFDVPLNEEAIAQVIRWQRAKSRSGNHETKTRSEVSGTGKKPWKQKGMGRARQGSLRSPQFRGGGVVFGPHKRDYEFKLNKKYKKLAATSALSSKFRDNLVSVVRDFAWPFEKTKDFVAWKEARGYKSILFVTGDDFEGESVLRVISNVPYVNILPVRGFNVLDCIKHTEVIFDVNAIEQITSRYSSFEERDDEEEIGE